MTDRVPTGFDELWAAAEDTPTPPRRRIPAAALVGGVVVAAVVLVWPVRWVWENVASKILELFIFGV
jgi:hypothetical protein